MFQSCRCNRWTVRYGDGWYGVAKSLDESRALIERLRELERGAKRAKPVEITLSLRTGHPTTLDQAKALSEMGSIAPSLDCRCARSARTNSRAFVTR